MCVDYQDLYKFNPKDDFPIGHIDVLVDNMVAHWFLSFLDGFLGHNQIKMAPKEKLKTIFITHFGTLCYVVMLFGLKNARETYQPVVILHDMKPKEVKVYIDDVVVKSKQDMKLMWKY